MDKIEGKEQPCSFCEEPTICVLKPSSGNYPARLQYQNPDGTPHFSVSDGTRYICPGSKIEDPKNKATQIQARIQTGVIIEHIAPTSEISDAVNVVLQALEQANTQCHKIYPGLNVNSDTFGMIRNAFVGHILSVYKKNKV
jgi:hypothetical protein